MSDEALWEGEAGTFVRVVVKTESREEKLVAGVLPRFVEINLKNPARKGKANKELLKRLADVLDCSTSEIAIASGHRSREKILLIAGRSASEVRHTLLENV
ncbi:DUF167 domain-containing protein [Candidatus Thorarchaeota archaeon]|nr:MAG: DUF167 domain-containing protein [Candidatus Thorarchaeota archaeon]